jgi:hypothetical protein
VRALHYVGAKAFRQMMVELSDLVQSAGIGSLRGDEMSDATITITNLGELALQSVHGITDAGGLDELWPHRRMTVGCRRGGGCDAIGIRQLGGRPPRQRRASRLGVPVGAAAPALASTSRKPTTHSSQRSSGSSTTPPRVVVAPPGAAPRQGAAARGAWL